MKAITVEPLKAGSARLEEVPEPDPREGSVLVEAIKDTANRGKGPICSCGIGELSLPATEEQTSPLKGDTDPQAEGRAERPDPERERGEQVQHKP